MRHVQLLYYNISVPSVVDVGYCLVGGCHVTQLVVKNEGGPGRFCIMPSAVWPTTNFKVIRQHTDASTHDNCIIMAHNNTYL